MYKMSKQKHKVALKKICLSLNKSFPLTINLHHFASMLELNEFHEGDNIGGVLSFEIAHVNELISSDPIRFKPGKIWRSINFHPNSGIFKEEENESEHGLFYSYAGSFKIHRKSRETDSLLRYYLGTSSLIRITDQNGLVQVIGGIDFPVTLTKSSDTGSNPTDMNQVNYSFSVSQIQKALFG